MSLFKRINSAVWFKKFLFPTISGFITIIVFKIGLSFYPESFYLNRDDGIITLSHAKNWIDFGFIGVNPSGEIVEGFSSPFEFLLFALVYQTIPMHYSDFFIIQWWFTTFLFGFVIYYIFKTILSESDSFVLFLVFLCSVLLSISYTFLTWHSSGMENPWLHFFYLLSLLILFGLVEGKELSLAKNSILLFFASIVRIESVYHLSFVFIIFFVILYRQRSSVRKIYPVLMAIILWVIFFVIRSLYFGKIFPNTSTAQDLSLLENLNHLFTFNPSLIKNWEIFKIGFKQNLLLLIPINLGLFLFFRRSNRELNFFYLSFAFLLPGIFHPFLIGNFRLDPARPMTWMLAISSVLFIASIGSIFKQKKFIFILVFLLTCFISYKNYKLKSYDLCCSAKIFEDRKETILSISKQNEIQLPLVAIADLGVMSFEKKLNVLDLGYLGNQFLARNKNDSKLIKSYISLQKPEILEIHFPWNCVYSDLMNDRMFLKDYRLVYENSEEIPIASCPDGGKIHSGIYLNRSMEQNANTLDRKIYDQFVKDLSYQQLKTQFILCNEDKKYCLPVARNVYRFISILKKTISNEEWRTLSDMILDETIKEYFLVLWKLRSPSEKLVTQLMNTYNLQ
ncbi:hypothetical protein EHQ91_03190 [Leptospira biflexa]|uniref:hypothetical protein n=1 Tax=Leptospira biflexa TaxID=172 RepID=UPI001090D62E|nr:hypothetical protein [Leptospira biflexa]TGM45221.1 hypothetical protein EHQ88_15180 [Leptospira biflexa]TGM54020.1 hypothetical protein EHQ91_03190 [Leptospira biflexa]